MPVRARNAVAILLGLLLASNVRAAEEVTGLDQLTPARVLEQTTIPIYGYKVAQTYPHDRSSFTEGLVMDGGVVYEGTGLYGHSKVLKWDLHTGHVLKQTGLSTIYFGEGVTILNGLIYQLTYLENTAFVYDANTLQRQATFRYDGQGWGLTNNGSQLLMSDGSSSIRFLDPKTFQTDHTLFVTDDAGPVGYLNELEFADGKLYANIWLTDFIAMIRPDTGKIIGWIDLRGLNPDAKKTGYPHVLNGIAYDTATGHLLVTGKLWPSSFEIELVARKR